jgi:uncharacterized protein (TIGR03000 family)
MLAAATVDNRFAVCCLLTVVAAVGTPSSWAAPPPNRESEPKADLREVDPPAQSPGDLAAVKTSDDQPAAEAPADLGPPLWPTYRYRPGMPSPEALAELRASIRRDIAKLPSVPRPPATPTELAPPPRYLPDLYYEGDTGWLYPGYSRPYVPGGPWTSFRLSLPFTSTPERPYPLNDPFGPFTALPFRNHVPAAPQDRGVIVVYLPVTDADVYLNGQNTRGTGRTRHLLTGLMPPNGVYQYYVTASYQDNGERVTHYRKVDVGAGEHTVADFLRQPLFNDFKLPPGPLDPNQLVPPTPTAGKYWP